MTLLPPRKVRIPRCRQRRSGRRSLFQCSTLSQPEAIVIDKFQISFKTLPDRGTTDPGHSLYNLNHFCDRNQFEGGMTCISSNFGHQMALLALVVNFISRWLYLHFLSILQIDSTFGHQVTSVALFGTKVFHQVVSLHCHIALECPIGIIS